MYEATAKPLVESALRGYNCTCFVYGQTGTGKTFSMEGVPGDAEYAGIIPRVMDDIFDGIQNMQQELEFIVRVSYIEIYLEKIRDLLEPKSNNLSVRESKERGVWIAGATDICCASAAEMLSVMRLGGANRVISSTRMNNDSSRSHSVFIITIEQRNVSTGSTKSGKLFLVDLAGSEKVGKTHAKGQTLKEAQHINKSLSALGSVMNALTSGQANAHIPYRDSKLTRLLQDSLGGNSETTLLVCASSSSYNSEETVTTLRFGTRAKNIKNKPKVNEERTVAEYKLLVAEKDRQIAGLQTQLAQLSGGDAEAVAASSAEADARIQQFMAKIERLEDEQASKIAELASLEERCVELEEQNKDLLQKQLEVASMTSRNEDFVKKLAFLETELEAKAKECEELNGLLERRKKTGKTPTPSPASVPEEEEEESSSSSEQSGLADSQETPPFEVDPFVQNRQNRTDSVLMDNELLHQQLRAKTHGLELQSQRINELSEELVNCRNFYDREVAVLQARLREYDSHLRGYMEISDKDDKTAQLDSLLQKTKTLRSVRGGAGGATSSAVPVEAAKEPLLAAEAKADDKDRSARSESVAADGWVIDDEVYPVAPIDMESPVVKKLLARMPEKGREKMAKWLLFVLEGRDIRSNFHPELSIEGINDEVNRDMRRLIVPLLKNRHDLSVQSFVRTRFVRISDLKITLKHTHQDTVHVEASEYDDDPTEPESEQAYTKPRANTAPSLSRSSSTTVSSAATNSSFAPPRPLGKLWARGHQFYGPKSGDPSESVLHGFRVLLPGKDRFISDPVDLSSTVSDSKTILEVEANAAAPKSGGGRMMTRLRSATNMGAMFGDVKTLFTARYHKNHVHEDTLCDGCGMSPIVGGKWKCNTCENVELCDNCYGAGLHGFEISQEMCRRIEQAAVGKHRLLAEYPELFELFRRHICHDDVVQFRRIVDWLCEIVSGQNPASIHKKTIVKSGLHPEIRARLVAQLGALASERPDLVLNTEWFVEPTEEEEEEDDDELSEAAKYAAAAASTAAAANPNGTGYDAYRDSDAPLAPFVVITDASSRRETLRMFVTDASVVEAAGDAVRKWSFSDLLENKPTSVTSEDSGS